MCALEEAEQATASIKELLGGITSELLFCTLSLFLFQSLLPTTVLGERTDCDFISLLQNEAERGKPLLSLAAEC